MKIAIWGAGKMGRVHGHAYQKLGKQAELVCVIEQNDAAGRQFGKEFGCRVCRTMGEMGNEPVDIIDICLPTHLHREAVETALLSGAAILCEKPLCLGQKEFQELAGLVRSQNATLMVGQVLRFWNGYQKARQMLKEGAIGRPSFISCARRQKMPSWSEGNWLMDAQKSGGLLADLCIHDIDFLNWIMGLPDRVYCETVQREDGTSLHTAVTLSYQGCCASIVGAWGMPDGYHNGELSIALEIVGDAGMLAYDGGDTLELIQGAEKQTVRLEHTDGYEEEIAYFTECVRDGKKPEKADLSTVEDTMRILWAARESCRGRRAVELSRLHDR